MFVSSFSALGSPQGWTASIIGTSSQHHGMRPGVPIHVYSFALLSPMAVEDASSANFSPRHSSTAFEVEPSLKRGIQLDWSFALSFSSLMVETLTRLFPYYHTNQYRKHSMPVLLFQSLLSALSRPTLMWSPAGPMTPESANTTRDKVELHGASYINVVVDTLSFSFHVFLCLASFHINIWTTQRVWQVSRNFPFLNMHTMSPIARLSMPRMEHLTHL